MKMSKKQVQRAQKLLADIERMLIDYFGKEDYIRLSSFIHWLNSVKGRAYNPRYYPSVLKSLEKLHKEVKEWVEGS